MKDIIQLHNISPKEFKNSIVDEVSERLQQHYDKLQPKESTKWLTRKETSEMLGVSLVTLYHWTKKNILIAYKIGNQVRYKKEEVEAAMIKTS